jgi:outer membrane protein OmpU
MQNLDSSRPFSAQYRRDPSLARSGGCLARGLAWAALAAGAATLVSTAAHAQDEATLYGVIDAGVTYVTGPRGSHELRADDGVLNPNRFGLKGREDLGDGLHAIYTLESGFRLNTGESNQDGRLFGRQAWVGLENGLGSLTLGRQYDFTWDYVAPFNISAFGSGYALHQGDFDRTAGDWFDNAIKFSSADFGGFSVGAMYAFSNRENSFHAGSGWSLGARYAHGPFTAAVAYTQFNQAGLDPYAQIGVTSFMGHTAAVEAPDGSVTDPYAENPLVVDKVGTLGGGASYAFDRLTLAGNITYTRIRGADGESSAMTVYEAGGTYNITSALQGVLGYQHTRFEAAHWNQASAALVYSLSKRTQVYVSGDYLVASAGTHAVIGDSFTPAAGNRQSDLRVGMSHSF